MRTIILASASPRRKKLLKQIGLKFIISPSKIPEKLNPRLRPRGQAEDLSLQKAQAVASNYPDAIIIAADTFVVLGETIIGKPQSKHEAERILQRLSGVTHTVVTGFTVMDTFSKKTITRSVESKVTFKKLSQEEIRDYVKTGEPLDKAGAYGVQEKGAVFVEKIEGDYFNVVGLPIAALYEVLKKFDIEILER